MRNNANFYSYNTFFKEWGSNNLKSGIYISGMYNSKHYAVHKEGKNVGIFLDGYKVDIADMYPHVVEELRNISGDYIIHAEMALFQQLLPVF